MARAFPVVRGLVAFVSLFGRGCVPGLLGTRNVPSGVGVVVVVCGALVVVALGVCVGVGVGVVCLRGPVALRYISGWSCGYHA
jgi:hypothetical protein